MDMIGRTNYRYTYEEYKNFTKSIIGSLVRLKVEEKNYGVGIVLNHRRYHGEIHIKIGWFCSPHFRFKLERNIGWHNYERIRFISKTLGEKTYDYKSENFGRKQREG